MTNSFKKFTPKQSNNEELHSIARSQLNVWVLNNESKVLVKGS